MEMKEQDILFSPLEMEKIKEQAHLKKSFGSYKSAFHHIAYNTYVAFLK